MDTYKILGQTTAAGPVASNPSLTKDAVVYSPPVGKQASLSVISILNTSETTQTYGLSFVKQSDVAGTLRTESRASGWKWNWLAAGQTGNQGAESLLVAADASGGTLIAGTLPSGDSINFGSVTVGGPGKTGFVAKFSSTGTVQWASALPSQSYDGVTISAAVPTADGGALVSGTFKGTMVFGTTSHTTQAEQTPSGPFYYSDAFIAKITPSGTWGWVRTVRASFYGPQFRPLDSSISAIRVLANGDILIAGTGPVGYGGSAATVEIAGTTLTNQRSEALLARFTASGTLVWAKTLPGYYLPIPTGSRAKLGRLATALADDVTLLSSYGPTILVNGYDYNPPTLLYVNGSGDIVQSTELPPDTFTVKDVVAQGTRVIVTTDCYQNLRQSYWNFYSNTRFGALLTYENGTLVNTLTVPYGMEILSADVNANGSLLVCVADTYQTGQQPFPGATLPRGAVVLERPSATSTWTIRATTSQYSNNFSATWSGLDEFVLASARHLQYSFIPAFLGSLPDNWVGVPLAKYKFDPGYSLTYAVSGDVHKAVRVQSIGPGETQEFTGGVGLQAGDELRLISTSTDVVAHAYGVEIS